MHYTQLPAPLPQLVHTTCPHSDLNGAAESMAAPAVPGPGVGNPLPRPKKDRYGVSVFRGQTVRRSTLLGMVLKVDGLSAKVRYHTGVEVWEPCVRLEVVRSIGRVKLSRGAS